MNTLFAPFNESGLNADAKRKTIFNHLKQKNFETILLQETRSTVKVEKLWEMELGIKIKWLLGTNKSRGLTILLKNNFNYDLLKTYQDPHGRFLLLEIKVKNSFLTIAKIYGPNVDDPDFFRNIFKKLNDFSKNEILVGADFNVILNNDLDKLNGSPHKNKLARQEILNYTKSLNLIEAYRKLHPNVKKFTSFQINPLIASRLDYFLVSKNIYFQVQKCDIVPNLKSDHKIVTLLVYHNFSPRNTRKRILKI